MSEAKNEHIIKWLKNKYVISVLIFVIWITLFDSNNLLERVRILKSLDKLHSQKEYYNEKIEYNLERIKELKTDKKNLEKFAREQYFMKKENEDIFIIEEGEEDKEKKEEE